jgi:hypothetical protein
MTRAVLRIATSSTGSSCSSRDPAQSARPSATISMPPVLGRRSSWPRLRRKMTNLASSSFSSPRRIMSSAMRCLAGGGVVHLAQQLAQRREVLQDGLPSDQVPRFMAFGRSKRFSTL